MWRTVPGKSQCGWHLWCRRVLQLAALRRDLMVSHHLFVAFHPTVHPGAMVPRLHQFFLQGWSSKARQKIHMRCTPIKPARGISRGIPFTGAQENLVPQICPGDDDR